MRKNVFIVILLCLALLAAPAAASAPGTQSFTADIRFEDGLCLIDGRGADWDGSRLTISEAGLYRLEGEMTGRIHVQAPGEVELLLCGLTVQGDLCALSADCRRLTLTLSPDFGQSSLLQSRDGDNGAALVCEGELVLGGSGSLLVQSASDGIVTEGPVSVTGGSIAVLSGSGSGIKADSSRTASGDLSLSGGSLTVVAALDGLRAENSLCVSGGLLSVQAGDEAIDAQSFIQSGGSLSLVCEGNGVKTENELTLSGGSLALDSALDGLQAGTDLTILGGELTLTAGGGGGDAINQVDSGSIAMDGGPGGRGGSSSEPAAETEAAETAAADVSTKGLKAGGSILMEGGSVAVSSSDDSLHATGSITIWDGLLHIISNDDGIHADEDLIIHGGTILLEDCFEGLEAANITVYGGDIDVFSVNDGLNTASGEMGLFSSSDDSTGVFTMNGGTLDIVITGNSSNLGDGVDANGSFYMNGGSLTASTIVGTLENGLDSAGNFVVSGGILAASGNSGMQESPSESSTQCTAVLSFGTDIPGGTECLVTDSEGNLIMTYTPANGCDCIILSHPDFVLGESYTLTAGTVTQDFSFSTYVYSGSSGGFGGGGFGGFGGGRGGFR